MRSGASATVMSFPGTEALYAIGARESSAIRGSGRAPEARSRASIAREDGCKTPLRTRYGARPNIRSTGCVGSPPGQARGRPNLVLSASTRKAETLFLRPVVMGPRLRGDDGSEAGTTTIPAGPLHPVPRAPAPEIAALLAHEARQHHVVHLGGAVDEARLARVAVDPFQDRVLGIAARAVELDRDVGGLVQRVGDVHLGHRHLLARAVALVELPGRVHHQEPPDLDAVRHLAELDLHALAVGEPDAKALALGDVGLRDLHRALGEPEPAHAVGEPRRPEPDLGRAQAVADPHQHVLLRHLEPLEEELAMAAVLLRAHDRDAANDAPARLVAVIEEGGEAAAGIVGGARDQDEMAGDAGAGDEPLAAVDHPAAALLLGAGPDHAGVGAAAGRRLGHGEGRAHVALDDRPEPSFLLRRGASARDEIHVAVVGGLAVEARRAEDRAVRLLVHRRPADDRQRHAAVLLGGLRRHRPAALALACTAA